MQRLTMRAARAGIAAGSLLILMTAAFPGARAQDTSAACNRDCLKKYVDDYAAALVNHDTASLPLAADVAVTENGSPVKPGEGILRQTIRFYSAPSSTQYVEDTHSGQVALMGVIDVGEPAMFAVRLRIASGKITEIENLVKRDGTPGGPFQPEGFLWREAPYIRTIPPKLRSSRAQLAATADSYWTKTVTTHKGQAYMPDCINQENGMNTDWERPLTSYEAYDVKANMPSDYDGRIWTCERELNMSTLSFKKVLPGPRLIDEERGLIMDWDLVRRSGPGVVQPKTMPDGSPIIRMAYGPPMRGPDGWPRGGFGAAPAPSPGGPVGGPAGGPGPGGVAPPSTYYFAELFRVIDGKISRQQAFWISLPADAQSPFIPRAATR